MQLLGAFGLLLLLFTVECKVFEVWRPTKLQLTWFVEFYTYLGKVTSGRFHHGAHKCDNNAKCHLVCFEENGEVTVWKLRAAPLLDESSVGPVKNCYTRGSRGHYKTKLTAISVTGTGSNPTLPARAMSNVIDGVHNYDVDSEYNSNVGLPVYMVIDLGDPDQVIKSISLLTPGFSSSVAFNDISVKIGTQVVTPGDYSTYKEVGYFSGVAVADTYWTIDLSRKMPSARYISIERVIGDQMLIADVSIILG